MKISLVGLLLIMLVSGCSAPPRPFVADRQESLAIGIDRARLCAGDWRAQLPAGRWRQSVLFTWRGRRVPMTGLLQLDRQQQTLQLLALNELGIKLFLLRITGERQQLQVFQPALKNYAGLEELLATALRRLFLFDGISEDARLQRASDGYRFRSAAGGSWFRLNGESLLLSAYGQSDDWQVDFSQLQRHQGQVWPREMVLQDHRRGYRLLVRNEEFVADDR